MRLRFTTSVWILAACAFAGSLPSALCAQSSRLYVGNSVADNVTVIDLNSLKVIGDIQVGPHVHGMAVQQDGKRLFSPPRTTILSVSLILPPANLSARSN